jgi:hypothetical protein
MLESALVPTLALLFEGILGSAFGIVLYLAGSIWASARAIHYTQGTATPVWLAFIWLVPCIGSILALIAIRKTPLLPPGPS